MKHLKKLLAAALATFMALVIATPAYAAGNGKITITNAAKGETYAAYKLFDATVSADGKSIAYTGTIPESLSDYFTKDTAGNISATDAFDISKEDVQNALKAWAETAEAAAGPTECTTSPMVFDNLDLGYYIVTTTQGETAISVDSTNPEVEIIDKNTTPPINNPTKTADDDDVFIGQQVTYTVSFGTANYSTENGDEPKQIVKYIISDNFANGALKDVTVTSIKVGGTDIAVQQFDANGKIEIAWVDADGKSLYANGATLEITYTATVADSAAIDGEGNTNTVTIDYVDTDGNGSPDEHTVTETVYTYAIAVQKVDQAGKPLAGATFQLPFYVKAAADTDGAYIYAGTTAADGLVNTLTTPDSGLIIVKGVQQDTYTLTETEAPDGYNKLTAPVTVEATKTGETTTSTTTYLDEDGNIVDEQTTTGSTVTVSIDELAATPIVVVNKTGAELPSTGGMGTTLFYVVGGLMVAGAAIALIAKSRVAKMEA